METDSHHCDAGRIQQLVLMLMLMSTARPVISAGQSSREDEQINKRTDYSRLRKRTSSAVSCFWFLLYRKISRVSYLDLPSSNVK